MSKSIYIIGPTSSGKSDLAVALAKEFNGEIVSCDSRQIYRHMDIGTGKEPGKLKSFRNRPSVTTKAYISQGIPHYLIDSHHPNTDFSAGKFVKRAKATILDIRHREKTPIICGGTMFWAQALLQDNVVARVKPNKTLRKQLRTKSPKQLLHLLSEKDHHRADQLTKNNEINNRVRLIRSIEIASALGKVPKPNKPNYTALNAQNLIIAIEPSKEILHSRIETRLNKRIKAGMLDEVSRLHFKHGIAWTRLEAFGLEYKWCTQLLRKQITTEEFLQKLLQDSFHYAKRQATWIRRWERCGAKIYRVTNQSQASKLVRDFL